MAAAGAILPGVGVGPFGNRAPIDPSAKYHVQSATDFLRELNIAGLASIFLIITAISTFASSISSEIIDPIITRILGNSYTARYIDILGVRFHYAVILRAVLQLMMMIFLAYLLAKRLGKRGVRENSVVGAVTTLSGIDDSTYKPQAAS